MGYSLELHYCQGKITDVSFIGHAECVCAVSSHESHETKSEVQCQHHCQKENIEHGKTDLQLEKEDCCKTEKFTFFSPTVKAHSTTEVPVWIVFNAILNPSFFLTSVNKNNVSQDNYSPPLFKRDISILTRTFLI